MSSDFTTAELDRCRGGAAVLGLGLELTRRCNLACSYCYADAGLPLLSELTTDELDSTIREAVDLGVRKVGVIGGGEPLLHRDLRRLLSLACSFPITVSLFTNGTQMTPEWARFLFENRISIVHKLNSLRPQVQDRLSGRPGVSSTIMRSLFLLQEAGYPAEHRRLAVETVVLPENIDEIPELWRWARARGIQPIVERLTPQGRARTLPRVCTVQEVGALFLRLSGIDEEEFGVTWKPQPPWAGPQGCRHHLYALYVRSDGVIQPCSGVSLAVGHVRKGGLRHALASPVVHELRCIASTIRGRCLSCAISDRCYGCRGAAFQAAGDYLAEDPGCWRDIGEAHGA